jgi:hypothetical protein
MPFRRTFRFALFVPLVFAFLATPAPAAAEIAAVGEPFPIATGPLAGDGVDLGWLPPGPAADQPAGFLAAWRSGNLSAATIRRAFVPQDPSVAPLPPLDVAGPGGFLVPRVAAGLDRRSAVVFGSQENGLDAALATVATLQPEPSSGCFQPTTDAALLHDGRLVVIYEVMRDATLGTTRLEGQLFTADGEAVGEPFELPGSPRQVRAVVPAPGGFLVFSFRPDNVRFQFSGGSLLVQRFDPQGQPLSPSVELLRATFRVVDVSVVPIGGGHVLVWSELGVAPDPPNDVQIEPYGLRLDAVGQPVGAVQPLLAGVEPVDLGPPAAAPGPGDTVLLAWFQDVDGGFELRSRLLTPDLAPASEVTSLTTSLAPVFQLDLAAGPAGDALAAWSAGGELLAQRLAVEGECTPSETVLCLQGGRFEVSVDWADFQGNAGPGRRVPVAADDSGLFWFFHPDNWEMLVKVIDGCPVNDHFWVFSAAATNVEYTLTVNDLLAHETRVFRNDLGDTARALTVTNAFPTCGAGGG